LRVAVRVGALVGGARPAVLRQLTAYGEHLGLAFQIADDLADAAAVPAADGRTDRALAKATYPATVGPAAARRLAARERQAALAAVTPLGAAAEALRAIATHVIQPETSSRVGAEGESGARLRRPRARHGQRSWRGRLSRDA